jgi:hypothetical protein
MRQFIKMVLLLMLIGHSRRHNYKYEQADKTEN